MTNKYFFRQLWLVFGVSLNIVSQSTISAITAILLPQLREEKEEFKNRLDLEAWIGAGLLLGAFFGSLLISLMVDRFGRKLTHLSTFGPITIGWIIILAYNNIDLMIAIRIIQGISIGIRGPIAAIIIGECTDAKYRGAFLASSTLSISVGTLFPHLLGTFLTWRWTAFACCLLNVASFLILLVPPDSPIWLAKVGRTSEARQAFQWYRGKSLEANDEIDTILKRQVKDDQRLVKHLKIMQIFRAKEFLRPLCIAITITLSYATCGTFTLSAYTVDILSKSLSGALSPYSIMIAFDSFKVFVTLLNCFVVKTFKRRHVLNFSFFITILALCSISAYIYIDKITKFNKDIVLVVLLFLYGFGVDIGLSSLAYIVMGEVFSVSFKVVGLSVALPIAYLSGFAAVFLSPYSIFLIGLEGTFIIFAIIVFICWIILFYILPETRDKKLHEIEDTMKDLDFADNNGTKDPMLK